MTDPQNNSGDKMPAPEQSDTTTRRRKKPRRNGKGSNAANSSPITSRRTGKSNTSTNNTVVETTTDDALLEDEAALAEGGVKAVGNKRIIPFMKIEKLMAVLSALIVIISLGAIIFKGLNLGLDFTGGVSADVTYAEPVQQVEVINALQTHGFDDPVVQYLGSTKDILVRLPPQSDNIDGLNSRLNDALDLPNNDADISSVNIIGSQVGNEIYLNSLIAIAAALGCMLLYVAVRFQFKLAIGALLALFHDAIVTIGMFALFGFPFDLTVLAAVLALIGYSLNDTIVVYDRIRENFRRVRGITPRQVIDLSLTETLRRTIMTVTTVMLVVLAMMFLGGDGLEWFSVALFIGLIAGTYSSIYIASSIPLAMGLSRDDFIVKVKPEFEEEMVTFNDPKASDYNDNDFNDYEEEPR
ncbi:protein translocase subunit SecF [Psychrobacter sp. I-STPA10]|uniref:protein translocase subunit SecF n=1 Tax=Psychrobacter sp. I-STPA10 TaxID=2585769 RepID=UPI003FA6ACFB